MKNSRLWVFALAVGLSLASGCGTEKTTSPFVPQDDAPPLPPSGLQMSMRSDGLAALSWAPNAEPDLAGYRVYIYDPAPERENAYQLMNSDGLFQEPVCTLVLPIAGAVWVRVTAVDQADHESSASAAYEVRWQSSEGGDSGDVKPPTPHEPEPGGDGSGDTTPAGRSS